MENDIDGSENFEKLWKKLKQYKKLYKIIDVLGNAGMIIALIYHQWLIAFFLFVMFFPDEVEIVRFFKRLINFKNENHI